MAILTPSRLISSVASASGNSNSVQRPRSVSWLYRPTLLPTNLTIHCQPRRTRCDAPARPQHRERHRPRPTYATSRPSAARPIPRRNGRPHSRSVGLSASIILGDEIDLIACFA
jgi:hypothetical protein